jgi:3-methyladenine DNA glycosylase AlkD
MKDIIKQVDAALKSASTPSAREALSRFFKEGAKGYGVKSSETSRIAAEFYKQIKTLAYGDILALCDGLMEKNMMEDRFVADIWAEKVSGQFVEKDFALLEKWVKNSVSNWAECDTLCNHTVGNFIMKYPVYISSLKKWSKSSNRWVKRAACVTLIIPARRGLFLAGIFELADTLRNDPDDMVQKGYGWMLKEASKKHTKEVFDYVMKYKKTMPRTAFRYAIEKMPGELKKKAMEK